MAEIAPPETSQENSQQLVPTPEPNSQIIPPEYSKFPMPEKLLGGAPTFNETLNEIKRIEDSSGITDRQRRTMTPTDYLAELSTKITPAEYAKLQAEIAARNFYIEQVGNIDVGGVKLFDRLMPSIEKWYVQLRGRNLYLQHIDIVAVRKELRKLRDEESPETESLLTDLLEDDAQEGVINFYLKTAISKIEQDLIGRSSVSLPVGDIPWSADIEPIVKRVEAELSFDQGKGWYLTELGQLRLKGDPLVGISDYLKYKESRATGLKPDAIFSELQKIDEAIDLATADKSAEESLRIKYLAEGKLLAFMADIFNLDTNQGNFDGLTQVLDAFCSVGKEQERTRDGFRERLNALYRSYGGLTARASYLRQLPHFQEYSRVEGLKGERTNPSEQAKHKDQLKWELICALASYDPIEGNDLEELVYDMTDTEFNARFIIDPRILAEAVDRTTGRFISDPKRMQEILTDVLGDENLAKRRLEEAQEAFVLSERMLKMWGWTARELGPRIWTTEKKVRNTRTGLEYNRSVLVNESLPAGFQDLGTISEGYKLFDDVVAERVQEEIDTKPDDYPKIPTYNISLSADSTARWNVFDTDDEIAAQKKLAEVWKLYHREWDKLVTDCRKERRHIEIARGPLFYKQAFYLPYTYDRTAPLELGGKLEQRKTPDNKGDFSSEAIADELSYYCQLGIRSLGDEFGWKVITVRNSRTGADEQKMVFGASTLREVMGKINRGSPDERAALGSNLRGKDVTDWIATLKGYKDQKSLIKGGAVGNASVPGIIVAPLNNPDNWFAEPARDPKSHKLRNEAVAIIKDTCKPYLDIRTGYGSYLNTRWPAPYPSDEISDLLATHYIDFICDDKRESDGAYPVTYMKKYFGRDSKAGASNYNYLEWTYKNR